MDWGSLKLLYTKTASGKLLRRSERLYIVFYSLSNTPMNAHLLEHPFRTTREFSFRSSSLPLNVRCCANSYGRLRWKWTRCHTTRLKRRSETKCPCVIIMRTGYALRQPIERYRFMAAMGIRGIFPSNTFGDTTDGTGLQRAVRRSRCVRWPLICSALAAGRAWLMRQNLSRSCSYLD